MEWNKIKAERKSLHIKMTLFVTSAVLIVSAAVLMVVAVREYRNYEAMLQDRISDDLSSISRIMEQRLLRVEETTATMATLASQVIPDKRKTDSLLYKSLAAINDVHGVSLVFDKDYICCGGGYYERYAVLTSSGVIDLGDVVNGAELENDPDWQNCYVNGKSSWGEQENYYSGSNPIISYFVPLCDKNGKRVGSAYSGVLDSYLTSFVTSCDFNNFAICNTKFCGICWSHMNMTFSNDDALRNFEFACWTNNFNSWSTSDIA